MKLRALLLPSLAVAGAWLLCAPAGLRAFVPSGDSLDLTQRDVRVFDNFTDPEAHLNTTPDLRWPGYTGPYLALWKACVEWGSEKHFEGNGDPHQPGGVGSGGANFDPSWQGAATQVGLPDDNIMSEISGNGVGVLAFCETPTSDGWRIRFYKTPWIWYDLPDNDTSGPSQADLQGVATHEYGHALGLNHSTDPQATMNATITSNEVIYRSIESDDIAGVQSIYGPRLANKPHIATYERAAGTITIRGANFSPTGNTVWWTQLGSTSDGTPVTVSGVASQNNGTELTVAVPAGAGPGDVLVQRAGTGNGDLSNAFPFNPLAEPCPEPVIYGTAKTTSQGSLPSIGWTGTPSTFTNDFQITLTASLSNGRGLLFYGATQIAVPFKGGWMLAGAPRHRVKKFTTDAFGATAVSIAVDPSLAGITRYYQFWYEDLADAAHAGTSNALKVIFSD